MQELADFKTAFAHTAGRRLGGEMLKKLGELKFPGIVQNPWVRLAVAKTLLGGPNSSIKQDGLCNWFGPGDVQGKLLAKGAEGDVRAAEQMLHQARQLIERATIPDADVVVCLGKLDMRTGAYLMKKGKQSDEGKIYPNVASIGKAPSHTLATLSTPRRHTLHIALSRRRIPIVFLMSTCCCCSSICANMAHDA